MTSPVNPGRVVKSDGVHHQRVAFPMTDRIAEPSGTQRRVVRTAIRPDLADIVVELENHEHPSGTLDDFHREWMKVDSRHAGRKTSRRAHRRRIDRIV